MTDLATKPSAEEALPDDAVDVDAAETARLDGRADTPSYAWAPAEEASGRRRTGLWIGITAGVLTLALVATSLILIAPGTAVAGVSVGGMTAGGAASAIEQRLSETTVVLTGDGDDVVLTGADLGASVQARALAEDAYADHPMWNPTQWFSDPATAAVTLDATTAMAALRDAAPQLFTDPVDATLAYDSDQVRYVTTSAADGAGVDLEMLRRAVQDAFAAGQTSVEVEPVLAPVAPLVSTAAVESAAGELNGILEKAGFYIGDERVVAVEPAVAASWLTVSQTADGGFEISADTAAIEEVVGGLAAAVDREAIDARVITDSAGEVLRTEIAGVSGRELGATDSIASDYAAQLAAGDPVFQVPVSETEYATTAIARTIEVDLGSQTTTLFENGEVFRTYAISSGLPGTPTPTGSFRVFAHVSMQDMGCFEGAEYCTEDVPWVTYFSPNIGFHGAYWHNNFGQRMSHGCVNMPVDIAKFVYDWAPTGTEVWVHS